MRIVTSCPKPPAPPPGGAARPCRASTTRLWASRPSPSPASRCRSSRCVGWACWLECVLGLRLCLCSTGRPTARRCLCRVSPPTGSTPRGRGRCGTPSSRRAAGPCRIARHLVALWSHLCLSPNLHGSHPVRRGACMHLVSLAVHPNTSCLALAAGGAHHAGRRHLRRRGHRQRGVQRDGEHTRRAARDSFLCPCPYAALACGHLNSPGPCSPSKASNKSNIPRFLNRLLGLSIPEQQVLALGEGFSVGACQSQAHPLNPNLV